MFLLLLVACKDAGNQDVHSDLAKAATACPAAVMNDACGQCLQTACCAALVDCEGDADCLACVRAEDDLACDRSPATHDRANLYLTCKGGACKDACIGGAGGSCVGVVTGIETPACQACLEQKCCDEVAACRAHEVCWDGCYTNHDEMKCHDSADGHALFHALGGCFGSACNVECGAGNPTPICTAPTATPTGSCVTLDSKNLCNPITTAGCAAAGAACDANDQGGFECFPAPNTQTLCMACGESDGWCAAGFHCVAGQCARYCCEDSECGAGTCDKAYFEGGRPAGICVSK